MRCLVAGYGPLGWGLVRGLQALAGEVDLVGVIPWSRTSWQARFESEADDHAFSRYLAQQQIPTWTVRSLNSFAFLQQVKAAEVDVLFVGSWGEILKPPILSLPGFQVINCHPSLLPKHRGPNPYVATLLSGDETAGVSFHVMDSGIDTGPLVAQSSLIVDPEDTALSLRTRLGSLAESSVAEVINRLKQPGFSPYEQSGEGSYDRLNGHIGWIDWRDSPEVMARRLRALFPWYPSLIESGRFRFSFRHGALRPTRRSHWFGSPPGTITHKSWRSLHTTTQDPLQELELHTPQWIEQPWLTSVVWPFILRPGEQLVAPTHPRPL